MNIENFHASIVPITSSNGVRRMMISLPMMTMMPSTIVALAMSGQLVTAQVAINGSVQTIRLIGITNELLRSSFLFPDRDHVSAPLLVNMSKLFSGMVFVGLNRLKSCLTMQFGTVVQFGLIDAGEDHEVMFHHIVFNSDLKDFLTITDVFGHESFTLISGNTTLGLNFKLGLEDDDSVETDTN